ncbi:MAG: hypothetical protein JWP10_679 [Nocardioidaceae bacterium]|nr:hypothetical protein [Nocardioidaceae bacterium]
MSNVDPEDYIVGKDATVSGIDLDKEKFILPDGTRLTDDKADRIIERVTRGRGRPSLTGGDKHSPQIAVRVPVETRDRLAARAEREGKTLSQLAREALESFAS